jgi:hypothetical protein
MKQELFRQAYILLEGGSQLEGVLAALQVNKLIF